jgi:hypothetical protein
MRLLKYFLMMTVTVLLSACSNTKVLSSWKSPGVNPDNLGMKKIMVDVLLPEQDRQLKKDMEQTLADDLRDRGINAVSADKVYGPKYSPDYEKDAVDKLRASRIDGFLTVVLLDQSKQDSYNPGYSQFQPIGYYKTWFGYYKTVFERVYTPGYYATKNKYYWESNLYHVQGEKLIYSGRSDGFDTSSVNKQAMGYCNKLITDMTSQGLISGKQ